MNQGRYRLQFNRERGFWMAVPECVRGRAKKSARRRLALAALLAASLLDPVQAGPAAPAANALPVARPANFVFSGAVRGGAPVTVGNAMTITTETRATGLNWNSFNIGSAAKVTFNQPDSSSRVINRVSGSSDPSQIFGQLNSNGQVYLINPNGIQFGAGAQVNVSGLIASALGLSDNMLTKLLNNGLPASRGDSLEFAFSGALTDFDKGFVTVETGATIRAADGGRVLLLAPKTVDNLGRIEGNGAEAILAAGGKVVLTVPDNPDLRGLLVETSAYTAKDALGNNVSLDGTVSNKAGGRIDTGSGGVVTLAALAVNQRGLVNASKAVNLNGTTMLVSGSTETERVTVNQRGVLAEIDWVSGFNVGAGKIFEVVQPSTGSVLYNYVYDPDRTVDGGPLNVAGRSIIAGALQASGQFVLINEKGIDFTSTADVKASNFVASALGINPAVAATGLLMQTDVTQRAFYLNKTPGTYSEVDKAGEPTRAEVEASALARFRDATVNVAAGAKITTGQYGYALLAGGRVNQGGTVTTPEGQVLLAAGADVYLKPAFSQALRGFTAEVNPLYLIRTWIDDGVVNGDGSIGSQDNNKVWNPLSRGLGANAVTNTGTLYAPLGNVSIVAHEINQYGVAEATTSVTSNGSLRFIARDMLAIQGEGSPTTFLRSFGTSGVLAYDSSNVKTAEDDTTTRFIAGLQGGYLNFAAGSRTRVTLDNASGQTATADQVFVPSLIESLARRIVVANGASIEAPAGQVQMRAYETFDSQNAFAVDAPIVDSSAALLPGVGVFVDDGAQIDVSGVDSSRSVADLFIEVELRGDEFADNPVQRNGKLRGQTAWVDVRDAVEVADLSGWTSKLGLTIFDKAATGGTISLGSSGSVVIKSGARLDVSGGKIDYAADTVSESLAVTASGKRYRLNDAPVSGVYKNLVTRKHKELAYVEGKSAGTVALIGHHLAVDGQLIAETTTGTRQREIGNPATNRYAIPLGGELILKDAGQHSPLADRDLASEEERIAAYTQSQIAFINGVANSANGVGSDLQAAPAARLALSSSLVDAGFSRFKITSDGRVDIPDGVSLNLPAGGTFDVTGRQVVIGGDISAPGGQLSFKTRDMSSVAGDFPGMDGSRFSTLLVEESASLSTAGRWVNDFLDGLYSTTPKAIHGGSISLKSAYDLDIAAGAVLDVSAGARMDSARKLSAGNAGSITLATGVTLDSKGKEIGGFDFTEDTDRRDASLFLDGTLYGYAMGKGGALNISTSTIRFGHAFSEDSRNWSRADRLARDQVGAAFTADFLKQGGFASFSFVGRDGVQVEDGVRLIPEVMSYASWGVRNLHKLASGTVLLDTDTGSSRVFRLGVFHADFWGAPSSLTLATRSLNFGDLTVGEGAYLGVSAGGKITLESFGQLSVLGTLSAPGGDIALRRPADSGYNETSLLYSAEKQSESIYLGPNVRLLAQGTTVLDDSTRLAMEAGATADSLRSRSRYKGQVLDGGKITLDAGLGYLIVREGALINVSGTTDWLNVSTLQRSRGAPLMSIGSAGGALSLAAHEGLFLDGRFLGAGGTGALGGGVSLRLEDGALSEDAWGLKNLNAAIAFKDWPDAEKAMVADRVLTLAQGAGESSWPLALSGDDFVPGTSVLDPVRYNGRSTVDLTKFSAGSFGSYVLSSQNELRFSGTIDLAVNNRLLLNAPRFSTVDDSVRVNLHAASLQIGQDRTENSAATGDVVSGGGEFRASALDIGVIGNFAWTGFALSRFTSQGEIHFDGTGISSRPSGAWTGAGQLEFAAARLSPGAYGDFQIDWSADASSRISVEQLAGAVASPSLSPFGRLTFSANTIEHAGTITAPLGEIVFDAPNGSVHLSASSVTSVAADQTLLLGYTSESGSTWNYGTGTVTKLPEKAIRINAAETRVDTGATLNLSGGGEALAWEFTSGPGGKQDVLADSNTTFAIVPGWSGYTSTDLALKQGYFGTDSGSTVSTLKVGDQIHLDTNQSGLSGTFTLLPARYALLPGAYLVSIKGSTTTLATDRKQLDGAWMISGQRVARNADGSVTAYASATTLALEVADATVLGARAKYLTATASDFFSEQSNVSLPGDAGLLSVVGRNTLVFDPTIVATRSAAIDLGDEVVRAGRGLQIDLAANKLFVSDSTQTAPEGWSTVDQRSLLAADPESVLLGGVRRYSDAVTNIEMVSSALMLGEMRTALQASEVMLTAKSALTLADGSRVDANGSVAERQLSLAGGGGFVMVSAGELAGLTRTGTVSRDAGDVVLSAGASVSGNALMFDATHDVVLNGNILAGSTRADGSHQGGAVSIGAGRVSVVADGTPVSGLALDASLLARFATLDQLRLSSYSTLDFYGNATLGATSLKSLILSAAGIAGYGTTGTTAYLLGQQVRFENQNAAIAEFVPAGTLGTGALQVQAREIVFADNASASMREAETPGFAVRGFNVVRLAAAGQPLFDSVSGVLLGYEGSGDIRFEGTGVTRFDNAGGGGAPTDLTLQAARLVTVDTADQQLSASGRLRVESAFGQGGDTGLGGSLALQAQAIDVAGRIETPAGSLSLAAVGNEATDGITIHRGGALVANGVAKVFADTAAYASGGKVALTAEQGDVILEEGALVSVSGASAGGNAGSASLEAALGKVAVALGSLFGSAKEGYTQGSLKAVAKTVSLDDLARATGGESELPDFAQSWSVRRTEGDLGLTSRIRAREVTLSTDAGDIDIAGTIDASGDKGGSIALYANRGRLASGDAQGGHVLLRAGSMLKANATEVVESGEGTAGRGGSVIIGVSATEAADELSTGIRFEGASTTKLAALIDVSTAAGSAAEKGSVLFRAPRQDSFAELKTLGNTAMGWSWDSALLSTPVATGSASALVVASPLSFASYAANLLASFKSPVANTGAMTLNINGKGVKSLLRSDGTPLQAGDIAKDAVIDVVYDGTAFRLKTVKADAVVVPAATGSSVAFTLAATIVDYQTAMSATFKAPAANTGALTLNIGGKGAKAVLRADGTPLQAGDVAKDAIVEVAYDGTAFRLVSAVNSGLVPATTGTATAFALSGSAAAYQVDQVTTFKASLANTGTLTLNVAGQGAKQVLRADGTALQAGDIVKDGLIDVVYDGSAFRLKSIQLDAALVAAATGTATAYTLAGTISSYQTNMVATFKAPLANTGATLTLNINGKGAKPIKRADGSALTANDIALGEVVVVVYDGTNFRLKSAWNSALEAPAATGTATAFALASTIGSYQTGMVVSFKAPVANTGATLTLNINGKGAKTIKRADGSALLAGDIGKDSVVELVYDGTNFRLSAPDWDSGRVIAPDATGTATALTLATPLASYESGMVATFKVPAANTGALTLNINGQGAKSVLRADGTALQAGDVAKDNVLVVVYDGSAFRLQSAWTVDAGTANAYKVTPTLQPLSVTATTELFKDGYTVTFRAKNANTGASTLQIVALDAKNLAKQVSLKDADGNALTSGAIVANQLVTAVYVVTDAAKGTGEFRLVPTALASGPLLASTMAPVMLEGTVSGAASPVLEGVRTTRSSGDVLLGAAQQAVLLAQTSASTAASSAAFLNATTASTPLSGLVYRPGEEIRASGDITVGNDWSFAEARFGGQPGALTLRAEGSLNLNATLSDGFLKNGTSIADVYRDARLATLAQLGESWSYRLIAGADTLQGNVMATRRGAEGDIVVADNKLIRTGTGDIAMAAAGDIVLKDRSAVYTAGVADRDLTNNFSVSDLVFSDSTLSFVPINNTGSATTNIYSFFPTGGGDLTFSAGGNIRMVDIPVDTKTNSAAYDGDVNEWLMRAGGTSRNVQWWSRIASFQQGIAAFAGGDVSLSAEGNISNVRVALPTSGRVPGVSTYDEVSGITTVLSHAPDYAVISGGGDLSVRAGRAVEGGQYYVELGQLTLSASRIDTLSDVATTFALGNAAASIDVIGDAKIGNVFNPLWVTANYKVNSAYNTSPTVTKSVANDNAEYLVRIGTYGEQTALQLVSVAGNILLSPSGGDGLGHVIPARVSVVALNGDITLGSSIIQGPGQNGQLNLLASGGIDLLANQILQLDLPASVIPSIYNPVAGRGLTDAFTLTYAGTPLEKHAAVSWHADDHEASRLIALNGDISGTDKAAQATLNESAKVIAGGDIRDVSFSVQNNHASDETLIKAGGEIVYQTSGLDEAYLASGIEVTGPGALTLLAGGSINLGDSNGVVTRGNVENPYLPEVGASIFAMAGGTLSESRLLSYMADLATKTQTQLDRLRAERPLKTALIAYYETLLGYATVPSSADSNQVRNSFFTLLRHYGREALSASSDESALKLNQLATIDLEAADHYKTFSYAEAAKLIATMFPDEGVGRGDINLNASQIKTEQGGNIELLTPGGSVVVGVANPTIEKKSSKQGIFTVRDGAIRVFARDDFLVNQSRVFTLDGGDILVWSSQGNIDAGSGAKTVSATPPPTLVIRNGQIQLDTSNSISGSGIGVLASRSDTPVSDMDLFAPTGTVDAGDAGLRSTGRVFIGAERILNANNIQAAAGVSGVAPAPAPAPAPATVTSPVANDTTQIEDASPAAGRQEVAVTSVLSVEILDPIVDQPAAGSSEKPAAGSAKEDDRNKKDKKR